MTMNSRRRPPISSRCSELTTPRCASVACSERRIACTSSPRMSSASAAPTMPASRRPKSSLMPALAKTYRPVAIDFTVRQAPVGSSRLSKPAATGVWDVPDDSSQASKLAGAGVAAACKSMGQAGPGGRPLAVEWWWIECSWASVAGASAVGSAEAPLPLSLGCGILACPGSGRGRCTSPRQAALRSDGGQGVKMSHPPAAAPWGLHRGHASRRKTLCLAQRG